MMPARILYTFRTRLDTLHARSRGDMGRFCTEKLHKVSSFTDHADIGGTISKNGI